MSTIIDKNKDLFHFNGFSLVLFIRYHSCNPRYEPFLNVLQNDFVCGYLLRDKDLVLIKP